MRTTAWQEISFLTGIAKACNNESISVWAKTHQDFTHPIKQFLPVFISSLHGNALQLSATYYI